MASTGSSQPTAEAKAEMSLDDHPPKAEEPSIEEQIETTQADNAACTHKEVGEQSEQEPEAEQQADRGKKGKKKKKRKSRTFRKEKKTQVRTNLW